MSQTAYLTRTAADTLAAAMTGLTGSYLAASNTAKDNALLLASIQVDSLRFQGRRYTNDGTQERAFPRVANAEPTAPGISTSPQPPYYIVWDWVSSAAAVPEQVKRAVVYQADALIAATRDERLDLQHDGVVYTSTGTQGESFKQYKGNERAPGATTGLCRLAWLMLQPYLLRTGRLV
jgi:hypothetical protein